MSSFKAPKLSFSNPFKSQGSSDLDASTKSDASSPAEPAERRPSTYERASSYARTASASASASASAAAASAQRGAKSASASASAAANSASAAANRRASEVLAKATAPPKVDPGAPTRVGFLGVSRDRKLVVWARDAEGQGPGAPVLSERYAALGRKMVARADPPGWDDVYDDDKRPKESGGGKVRCIKLPVCDLEGTTAYVVAFGAGYPTQKAQELCERLALLLGPMVDTELGATPTRAAVTPDGARRLREVLEREIADANSNEKLQKVANQVEEVRGIMERNVEMLLDRGQKLEELDEKSDNLSKATNMFRKKARDLRRWHLMNQVKWGVAVGTMVTASVAIPIAILAAA